MPSSSQYCGSIYWIATQHWIVFDIMFSCLLSSIYTFFCYLQKRWVCVCVCVSFYYVVVTSKHRSNFSALLSNRTGLIPACLQWLHIKRVKLKHVSRFSPWMCPWNIFMRLKCEKNVYDWKHIQMLMKYRMKNWKPFKWFLWFYTNCNTRRFMTLQIDFNSVWLAIDFHFILIDGLMCMLAKNV